MAIKAGDRVKLTEKAARAYSKHYGKKIERVDWQSRRGTATRVNDLHPGVVGRPQDI